MISLPLHSNWDRSLQFLSARFHNILSNPTLQHGGVLVHLDLPQQEAHPTHFSVKCQHQGVAQPAPCTVTKHNPK